VAPPVVGEAWALLARASGLLVLGTSLEVFSGRRFVLEANKRGLPIVLINRGPTRADDIVTVKIDGGVAPSLAALFG